MSPPPQIPRDARLAVLFGAGASFGYTDSSWPRPPLGRDLFGELSKSPLCPAWQTSEIRKLFSRHNDDFEAAMAEITEAGLTPQLYELTYEMCHYLVQFRLPNAAKPNLYAAVINTLLARSRISDTLLCSLNYECLLEETLCGCLEVAGHAVPARYLKGICQLTHPLEAPTILKLHGSANFFPFGGFTNVTTLGSNTPYLGPTEVHGISDQLREHYAEGLKWPFICYYASDKRPHIQEELKYLPVVWSEWVAQADAVIVIGAMPTPGDGHIWLPVIRSSARVYFSAFRSSDGDYLEQNIGGRYSYIGQFSEAAETLVELL